MVDFTEDYEGTDCSGTVFYFLMAPRGLVIIE